MMRRRGHRQAFTLVEILIVLLIIGILAGALMLVSFSATSKAQAMRIIADMRSMKSAATLYFIDYGRWPLWMTQPDGTYFEAGGGALPSKYLEKLPDAPDYWIGVASSSDKVAIMLDASLLDLLVRQRLEDMTPEIPLIGTDSKFDFASAPYVAAKKYVLWYIKNP